jgi:hypothetical protein
MTMWHEQELAAARASRPGMEPELYGEHGVPGGSGDFPTEGYADRSGPTGWVGWLLFAGIMLIMLGAFQAILGVVALLDHGFFVANRGSQVIIKDYTTWGWVHIALAAIAVGAGIGLLLGLTWARVIAVILCVVNVIISFAFLGAYPWWGVLLIAFSVITAYGIVAHGGEMEESIEESFDS